MGPCQSGEASEAEGWPSEPEGFGEGRRVTVDKKTDEVIERPLDADRPDDDFFDFDEEVQETVATKEFLAVKPWIGAIAEPDDHPPVNKEPPDEQYELEYVYGYRCEDSRQNVYYNPDGKIVYMTACLGIILDQETNTQTFFGGGSVENQSKQVANDLHHHTNDIMAMNVNTHGDREWAVTGQVGKSPPVFVWNTRTGEKKARLKLAKAARAVAACAISTDCTRVATVDKHNDHNVAIWDASSGAALYGGKGGPDPIHDIAFTRKEGAYEVFTAGTKHFGQWLENGKKKKGLFGSHPRCSFACVTTDDQGLAYAGGTNALIYVFAGNTIKQTLGYHGQGFIGALTWQQGKLYSGGRDGRVVVTDTSTMEQVQAFEFGVLPRALDSFNNEKFVVGLRTGSIVECDLATGEMKTVMESHNDGEVWGLDFDATHVYTTGDDNQVKRWDPTSRKCVDTAAVNDAERKARRNRASTLGRHPDSQSARAVAVNNTHGHVAVCANDGSITVRTLDALAERKYELTDSLEWIECAEYSPCGKYLAAGSHDTNIYIYDAESDYSLVGKCSKHNAALTCIDWSQDSCYIRSVCNAYELLFFMIPSCDQDPSGASNTTGTAWASQHCKFGWTVDGVFPRGCDGSHINGVD